MNRGLAQRLADQRPERPLALGRGEKDGKRGIMFGKHRVGTVAHGLAMGNVLVSDTARA